MVQAWVALLGSVLALVAGLVQGREMAKAKALEKETALEEWALELDYRLAQAQELAMVQEKRLESARAQVTELARLLVGPRQEARDEQAQGSESESVLAQGSESVLPPWHSLQFESSSPWMER